MANDFGLGWRGKSSRNGFSFNDEFGVPAESNSNSCSKQYSTNDFDYDSVFRPLSFPVYDNEHGLQGLKKESAAERSLRFRPMPESLQVSVSIGGSKPWDIPLEVRESSSVPGYALSRIFTYPSDDRSKLAKSRSARPETSSISGAVPDDLNLLNSFRKGVRSSSPSRDNGQKNNGPSRSTTPQSAISRERKGNNFFSYSESNIKKKITAGNFQGPPSFQVPSVATYNTKYFSRMASPLYNETRSPLDMPPKSGRWQDSDDIWLTVSDIPLCTQATVAPPPSRRTPPIPRQPSRSETGSILSSLEKAEELSSTSRNSQYFLSSKMGQSAFKNTVIPRSDELGDFVMGRCRNIIDESVNLHVSERINVFPAAAGAAIKNVMDEVEAKLRHAKEVHELEHAHVARNKVSMQPEEDQREIQESLEKKQNIVEGREVRILEKGMERVWEIERVKARQAVERETGEAHERTAYEARERAAAEAHLKTEWAAIEKTNADAQEHAEKAAVLGARTETCERAAAECKERAAAAEAKEKEARDKAAVMRAEAEYRIQAPQVDVERAAPEAREKTAAEAPERAPAAVKMNLQNGDTDLESFFSIGRASSAPRPQDPMFDQQIQCKARSGAAKNLSTGASFSLKKALPTTNIVDNISSIFGAGPVSGEFQEVERETEERRSARKDRHQLTKERAAKALAEKNQRDLLAQREQEERHRIADALDIEIKRWAAGKEGNLRALLSTLQYVLWPECGWQPVSLTDLMMGASVKKMYRRATLFIHPDKVQQKGATLEQKCIAEKVFDLLKEAWNKFKLEEHF